MIMKAPLTEMSWRERITSRKKGVRFFIISLLLWADELPSVRDGSSTLDWTRLAADVVLVLQMCTKQLQLSAENTVVTVEVIRCWPDEYAKSTRPMEKQVTERTRNARGDRLIQMSTHHGTLWPGERLKEH